MELNNIPKYLQDKINNSKVDNSENLETYYLYSIVGFNDLTKATTIIENNSVNVFELKFVSEVELTTSTRTTYSLETNSSALSVNNLDIKNVVSKTALTSNKDIDFANNLYVISETKYTNDNDIDITKAYFNQTTIDNKLSENYILNLASINYLSSGRDVKVLWKLVNDNRTSDYKLNNIKVELDNGLVETILIKTQNGNIIENQNNNYVFVWGLPQDVDFDNIRLYSYWFDNKYTLNYNILFAENSIGTITITNDIFKNLIFPDALQPTIPNSFTATLSDNYAVNTDTMNNFSIVNDSDGNNEARVLNWDLYSCLPLWYSFMIIGGASSNLFGNVPSSDEKNPNIYNLLTDYQKLFSSGKLIDSIYNYFNSNFNSDNKSLFDNNFLNVDFIWFQTLTTGEKIYTNVNNNNPSEPQDTGKYLTLFTWVPNNNYFALFNGFNNIFDSIHVISNDNKKSGFFPYTFVDNGDIFITNNYTNILTPQGLETKTKTPYINYIEGAATGSGELGFGDKLGSGGKNFYSTLRFPVPYYATANNKLFNSIINSQGNISWNTDSLYYKVNSGSMISNTLYNDISVLPNVEGLKWKELPNQLESIELPNNPNTINGSTHNVGFFRINGGNNITRMYSNLSSKCKDGYITKEILDSNTDINNTWIFDNSNNDSDINFVEVNSIFVENIKLTLTYKKQDSTDIVEVIEVPHFSKFGKNIKNTKIKFNR